MVVTLFDGIRGGAQGPASDALVGTPVRGGADVITGKAPPLFIETSRLRTVSARALVQTTSLVEMEWGQPFSPWCDVPGRRGAIGSSVECVRSSACVGVLESGRGPRVRPRRVDATSHPIRPWRADTRPSWFDVWGARTDRNREPARWFIG